MQCNKLMSLLLAVLITPFSFAAGLPKIEITPEWKTHIKEIAPESPSAVPAVPRKVLLFSLMTGFQHWVTPHTSEVIKILAEKSGAFEIIENNDVNMFSPENIAQFDAIILNNTCSKGPRRNIFIDALGEGKEQEAAALEQSLISHTAAGHGLVAIHGAITMMNSSEKFGKLLGGAFDFHPPQQEVTLDLTEPEHPLVKAFEGKPFIHVDEPYFFTGAYNDKNFRPLLSMDASKITMGKKLAQRSGMVYAAWIKKHGDGRVFYVSPSHNAQSFEDPRLLKFYLDGIQYALGDLKCDDSVPAGK